MRFCLFSASAKASVGERALVGGLSKLSVCDPLDFKLSLLESGEVLLHSREWGDFGLMLMESVSGELSVRFWPDDMELDMK